MMQKRREDKIFFDLGEFTDILGQLPSANKRAEHKARRRNDQLTKPEGSLGRLEELAIWYHAWRTPSDANKLIPQILVFAANHGIASHQVSAYPSDVTEQMVENFFAGGAAINQLAKIANGRLDVVPLKLDSPTADLSGGPAMTESECTEALKVGWTSVDPSADLLLVGEMGIGNTTSAAAICYALFGGSVDQWVGRGTGVADATLERKKDIVQRARLANITSDELSGLEILRRLGGFELSAMAGAVIKARMLKIPVLLDGFVSCAAAACLQRQERSALDHTVAAHLSAELPHAALLARMGKTPILELDMRLGEASGAAVAAQIVKCALACHCGMATFTEAGVSGR